MWRLEKDPHLSSTFANVIVLDRPPDFDAPARPDGAGDVGRAAAAAAGAAGAGQPRRRRCGSTTPTSTSTTTSATSRCPSRARCASCSTSPRLIANDPFDRTRPLWQFVVVEGLRGGKAALVQKLHHTITDGEGGVQMSLQFLDFERDAPEPPPADRRAGRRRHRRRRRARRPPTSMRDLRRRRPPAAARRRPPGARRCSPTRRRIPAAGAATADTVRGVVTQLSRRRAGPLAAVDRALAAPADRGRAGAVRRHQGRGQAPRRHAEHGVPDRRRRGRLALPRRPRRAGRALRTSMAVSTRTDERRAPTRSRSPACWCPRARCRSPTGSRRSRRRRRGPRRRRRRRRWRRWPPWPPRCRPRWSPASPASRPRPSTSPRPTCAAHRCRCTSPAPSCSRTTRSARSAGVAFNLTLLSYNDSLDMGVNIDAAAVTEPELLRKLPRRRVRRPRSAA